MDSWFEVAVNGRLLAQSHGSRLPTEVDVTDALADGDNLLAVRVTQWSAQTYVVEDQDQPDAAHVGADWSGHGPHESYAGSSRAALAGRWRHTVEEVQTRYTHPQENGARRGVTRARLGLAAGPLTLPAGEVRVGGRLVPGLELSARPWSDAALALATHPHDLAPDGALWLHLDATQHGLGSAACGPGVLPNATLRAAPVTLQVRLTVG